MSGTNRMRLSFDTDAHLIDDVVDVAGWIPVRHDRLRASLRIRRPAQRLIGTDLRRLEAVPEPAPCVLRFFGTQFGRSPRASEVGGDIDSRDVRFTRPGKATKFDR